MPEADGRTLGMAHVPQSIFLRVCKIGSGTGCHPGIIYTPTEFRLVAFSYLLLFLWTPCAFSLHAVPPMTFACFVCFDLQIPHVLV